MQEENTASPNISEPLQENFSQEDNLDKKPKKKRVLFMVLGGLTLLLVVLYAFVLYKNKSGGVDDFGRLLSSEEWEKVSTSIRDELSFGGVTQSAFTKKLENPLKKQDVGSAYTSIGENLSISSFNPNQQVGEELSNDEVTQSIFGKMFKDTSSSSSNPNQQSVKGYFDTEDEAYQQRKIQFGLKIEVNLIIQ